MSIKLLPASVNPVDPPQAPDGTTSLVPLTHRAIATRAGQISLAPSLVPSLATSLAKSAGAFAWSSSTRQGGPKFIDGTPVEDPQSDETGYPRSEYVSGWAGSYSVESTAIAHYLFYATGPTSWSGRLINLYA